MAVVVPISGGYLHTASGCYRAEAYNLSTFGTTTAGVNTKRIIPFTPANAATLIGGALYVKSQAAACDRNLLISLQENKGTCTTPIASPGVVTLAGHGFSGGERISFSTTGALPTGITAAVVYYVKYINANTFNISATSGGTNINFTGSTSGTHTLWQERQLVTMLPEEVFNTADKRIDGWVPFALNYAVTAAANTWRLDVYQDAGTTGNWNLGTSLNTSYFPYCVWSNVAVTYADSTDTVFGAYKFKINQATTTQGILDTSDATNGISMVLCRTLTPDVDNVATLTFEEGVSPYSFVYNGHVIISSHSGIRLGTSTGVISAAKKITISQGTKNVGSATPVITSPTANGAYNYGRGSIFAYGEKPSVRKATIASDANNGQKVINVLETTGWSPGQKITIGKNDSTNQGDLATYTIDTVVGTQITVTTNLATYVRKAGGNVILLDGYGIEFNVTGAAAASETLIMPSNFVADGVIFNGVIFAMQSTSLYPWIEETANELGVQINDCVIYSLSSVVSYFMSLTIGRIPYNITNCLCFRMLTIYTCYGYKTSGWKSSTLTIDSCVIQANYVSGFFGAGNANARVIFTNNVFENSIAGNYTALNLNGVNWTVHGNTFWGIGGVFGAIRVWQLILPTLVSENTFDKCAVGIYFDAYATKSVISENNVFGANSANTTDIHLGAGAIIDWEEKSPTGNLVIDITNQDQTVPGSMLRITDFNDALTDDRVILTYGNFQRCNASTSDTLVRTAGGSSLRMQSISSTNPLEWIFDIATANQQSKPITIGVYMYINNANYWAGTNRMPRITVTYDNGSTTYGEAAQIAGQWQYVHATFTPLTTYGSITVAISVMTDATSTDAYVYIDDFSGGFLVNTTMDYWSHAIPVPPAYSFNVDAATFWDADTDRMTQVGSMGKKLKGALTLNQFMGLK